MAGRLWSVFLWKITNKEVINYIENQELHHKKKSFLEEYRDFLKAFEIDFDERYIFQDLI